MSPSRSSEAKPRLIDQQNRVALPPNVLAALDANAGDYVAFDVSGKTVTVVKVTWSKR